MPIEIVSSKEATVYFDASKCIHSRACILSHPDVFVPNVKGAWIHPEAQSIEELIRIAKNCVSGAISVTRTVPCPSGYNHSNGVPLMNTVRVRENGPLAVEAQLKLEGNYQSNPRVTLCRCGHSKNKPYCDGSHVAANFQAETAI